MTRKGTPIGSGRVARAPQGLLLLVFTPEIGVVSFYTIRVLSSVTAGELVLTSAERDQLLTLAGGGSRVAVRARIVLACSDPGVVYARLAEEHAQARSASSN